jgi:hypothetical protein
MSATRERLNLTQPVTWKLADEQSGPRRFSMLAYTGAIFDVGFGPSVIDLLGLDLPSTLPIFRQHDPNQYIGRAEQLALTASGLEIAGYLFDTPEAAQVARMSDQGAAWQASIGISFDLDEIEFVGADASLQINGRTLQGPFVVLRKAALKESSFVPLGADAHTSALALADAIGARLSRSPVPPLMEAVMADPLVAERERVKAITDAFAATDPTFALHAATSGMSLLEAKAAYADKLQAKLAAQTDEQAKKIADLEAKLAQASKPNPAGALSGSIGGSPGSGDPIEQWNEALAAECERLTKLGSDGLQRNTLTASRAANVRGMAVANLVAKKPELHRAYLEAHNARRPARQGR